MGSVERVGLEGRTSRRRRLQMQLALDMAFSLKKKTCLAVRHRTACFPTHYTLISLLLNTEHRIQKWFMHMKQKYFVLSKQDENMSSRNKYSCKSNFVQYYYHSYYFAISKDVLSKEKPVIQSANNYMAGL